MLYLKNSANPDPSLRAAPFFCGGVTAYSALLRVRASAGQLINIIGCGGVGKIRFSIRLTGCLQVSKLSVCSGHLAIMLAKKMGYRIHACKIYIPSYSRAKP